MQKVIPQDIRFMRLALQAAEKGRGRVHPNPLVGAVLVKGRKVLSQGAHEFFGGPHAEVNALRRVKSLPAGSTLYTTLEPCVHFGKTPPCVDLILSKKVSRVVVGATDPNPRVAGKGLRHLKKAGVGVTLGVLGKETEALNRDFRQWILNKTPYVIVKVAQSLDGKIAGPGGRPTRITGKAAQHFSHGLRARADAILVGVNTVLKDDPRLNVRLPGAKRHPLKVVLDAHLRTPLSAKIFSQLSPGPVVIFTTRRAAASRARALRKKAEVIVVREKGTGRVAWRDVLRVLGQRGVVNLLVEGGGEVIAGALAEKIVKEAYVFTAPKVLGKGVGFSKKWAFRRADWERVGRDLLLHGTF